jgi:CHAT domain-containing protein
LYTGEGVFSFNRSFAALGIPSSVANLWKVDNEATYKLTELFYKYMSKGMPLDVALQKAKKEFRDQASTGENKLPYYWAAPILVGKSDVIPLQKKSDWDLFTCLAFLTSFIFSGWTIRKTKILRA